MKDMMKEQIQALLSRRSIREYDKKQITEEQLQLILEAGKYAPSGMGEFKWRFLVIQQNGAMDKVLEGLRQQMGLGQNAFYHAPTAIVVFVDRNAHTPVQDGSLAIGNMMNAAYMLGLGSCWINCVPGFFATDFGKKMQEDFRIPSDYICIGSCAIGYAKGEYPQPKVRDESIIVRA